MKTLQGDRVILRRFRADDLDDLHRVFSDPLAMTWWSRGPHTDLQETQVWLADSLAAPAEGADDFAVLMDDVVIGKLGCYQLPNLGYIFHPDHWGRGLAGEAMALFLRHVAERAGLDHLQADVDPRNGASIRLLERFGFQRSGFARNTWHTHIGWCDSLYLTLDRAGLDRWLKSA